MNSKFHRIRFFIISLIGIFLVLPFFIGGKSYAADDLLKNLYKPAKDAGTYIDLGENVKTVGNRVFRGSTELGAGVTKSGSVIVKVTRLLLILTIALSITMILYNGMMYIIQTGQGKEGKSLMTNIGLIVVGIFVSLFSVVAINLIQSIPDTLNAELKESPDIDKEPIKGKAMSYKEFFKNIGNQIKDGWNEIFNKHKKDGDTDEIIKWNADIDKIFESRSTCSSDGAGGYTFWDENGNRIVVTAEVANQIGKKIETEALNFWKERGFSPHTGLDEHGNIRWYADVLISYDPLTTGSVDMIELYKDENEKISALKEYLDGKEEYNFEEIDKKIENSTNEEEKKQLEELRKERAEKYIAEMESDERMILMAQRYYYNRNNSVEFKIDEDGKYYFYEGGQEIYIVESYLRNFYGT